MRRFDHREKLRSGERLAASPAQENESGARLTRERVARIAKERRDMLGAIEDAITAELHGALEEKLRYEEALLGEAAEREDRATDLRESRQKDLPSEHFIKKRLDTNLI